MAGLGVNYSVTGDDLSRFGLPVKTYSELRPNSPVETCALLYEIVPGRGHWVLLLADPGASPPSVEFFDPYGVAPDVELGLGAKLSRRQGPVLSSMLERFEADGGQVTVSSRQMQSADAIDRTCGRWVLARWLSRNTPLEEWLPRFPGPPKMNDELIVEATRPFLGR